MLLSVQEIGDRLEPSFADLDKAMGIGFEVVGPRGTLTGRDEDGSVRVVDEPDCDPARTSAPTTGRRQQGDAAVATERAGDLVRGDPQRARCQDLPSVATDGA